MLCTSYSALNLAKRFKILDDEDLDTFGDECHDLSVSPDDDMKFMCNTNITRLEVGPQTIPLKGNERLVTQPLPMVVVKPGHYCIIQNPCRSVFINLHLSHINVL
eukprot:XP_019930475.1 PREDICTED: uncharacterized protein LOC109621090 [Crassostrea gigas]